MCGKENIKYNFSNEIHLLKEKGYSLISFSLLGFPINKKDYIKLLGESFIKEEYLYKAIYFLNFGEFIS